MGNKRFLMLVLIFLPQFIILAQDRKISGIVTDETTNEPLIGATVIIANEADSSIWKGVTSDALGVFSLSGVAEGKHRLKVSYISYEPLIKQITVSEDLNLGRISLKEVSTKLNTVTVEGKIQRAQQMGDTTQYNANAFKTNPDANTEDLVTKMPGVTSDNGTLKVNGENVQQILVDGKPFFGDDPNVALKNLPAEIVDKIQVFDRQSEQSQFNGFDDGQTTKTINIVTRPGMNNGQFGRIFAGYGTDDRYIAGGNFNLFKGDRRISIIGLSNNINQQNFSSEDLVGAMAGSSSGGRGGNRGGMRGGQGGGRGGFSGSSGGNFLTSQQPGIANTNSIGFNYSDVWGSKVKVTGSYFLNNTDNVNNSSLNRTFITSVDSGLYYNERSRSENNNYNHRFNLRMEYTIDSSNSIVLTPRVSFQKNYSDGVVSGITNDNDGRVNSTQNQNNSNNNGLNFSNNLLFRHRFEKKGRTFSIGLTTEINNRDGVRTLNSLNQYAESNDSTINQRTDQTTKSYTISSNISYTEPIGKFGQVQVNYSPSYRKGNTDKSTRNFDDQNQEYFNLDTALSNTFENTYITQKGGASYRFNNRKINFSTGLNFQYSTLSSEEEFPQELGLEKSFRNVLPQASFNYRFAKDKNVRVFYRTSTNAPSVNQLQNVLDNSSPLFLTSGNPNLKQEYNHSVSLRYGNTNTTRATSLFFFANASFTNNYIANATYLATSDLETINGIELNRGTQLSIPVNLDGYWNSRTFFTYGTPVSFIKSNLNLNTGFTYNSTPGLINSQRNMANNYNFSQGVVLSSNISEKIDFTLSYTGNYSIVRNTLQKQSDNNYYIQNASVKVNWMPWKGLVFNTNVNQNQYWGLSQSFNQQFVLWNASVGYKMLKNRSLELKASVFDILNQNNSISRNVTETYIEDAQTTILRRYLMFTITYNIRNFKKV